jgi:hypothetical protein
MSIPEAGASYGTFSSLRAILATAIFFACVVKSDAEIAMGSLGRFYNLAAETPV